jgi:hypothetical protein
VDPTEHKSLASTQPQKVAMHRDMAQEWFLDSERQFTVLEKGGNKMNDTSVTAGDT